MPTVIVGGLFLYSTIADNSKGGEVYLNPSFKPVPSMMAENLRWSRAFMSVTASQWARKHRGRQQVGLRKIFKGYF